jgi:curved DNA-binding protein CbpA
MSFESFNNPAPQPEKVPPPPTPRTEIPKHLFSKDAHEVLGVPKTASAEEIEEARKNLQRKFHPDVNKDPKATQIAQNINNAYDIINKKDKYAVLGGPIAPGAPHAEKASQNEMIIMEGGFDVGLFADSFWDDKLRKFCQSKNVKLQFSLEKDLLFAKRYKIKLEGRRVDAQAVASYLKNPPWEMGSEYSL